MSHKRAVRIGSNQVVEIIQEKLGKERKTQKPVSIGLEETNVNHDT